MQAPRRGSIINTASFVAVMGSATSQISYTASKGGVLAMSRELGVQFARQGIRVNALCPGPVNTPLLQELFAKTPSGPRAGWCTCRWADSPSRRRSRGGRLPGQRRRLVHHRQHVPRRRRDLRCVRDAA
jgi:NAD(P)-dependent dehydrogenase (short-subunit alcohol dehydrogenase family)